MSTEWIFLSFAAAFVVTLWLHPKVVKIANIKGITDNPDKRKLQRQPVPVLGGTVVFMGIAAGMGLTSPFFTCSDALLLFAVMLLMLYTGTMDDIIGLTPKLRFIIEILAITAVMFAGKYGIDDFHGLWGIGRLPAGVSIPLTIISCVGIINAVNLIDGVDGLSSGFCIMACSIFGVYFWITGDMMMAALAASCVGAVIPFFIHNVFGKKSKMFIGDGGTLAMGMTMSLFVLRILDSSHAAEVVYPSGRMPGLIPFTLAVLSIPVFDTVRVMTTRILRRTSPFNPDKKHLHHVFIELGFTHLKTTLTLLTFNLLIIGGWYAFYRMGYSVNAQMLFVVIAGVIFTAGIYLVAKYIIRVLHRSITIGENTI